MLLTICAVDYHYLREDQNVYQPLTCFSNVLKMDLLSSRCIKGLEMETIFLVIAVISLFVVCAADTAQKRRAYLMEHGVE